MKERYNLPWPRMADDGVTPIGIDLREKSEDIRRIVHAKCRYQPDGMTIDDMVQQTLLGIYQRNKWPSAYDPRKVKLSTYVVMVMQNEFGRISKKKSPNIRLDEEDVHTRRDDRAEPKDPISAFEDAEEALDMKTIRAIRDGASLPQSAPAPRVAAPGKARPPVNAAPAPSPPRGAKRGLTLTTRLYGSSSKRNPAERQQEIETMLVRYGAKKVQITCGVTSAVVLFKAPESAGAHYVRIEVPMPAEGDVRFAGREGAFDRATRQRWAATALIVKSKLEAVVAGIETFESAFLASILLPNGLTFQEWARPQLAASNDSTSDDGVLEAEFDDEPVSVPAAPPSSPRLRLPLAPADKVKCKPMSVTLAPATCMKFQREETCKGCAVGLDVARLLAGVAA